MLDKQNQCQDCQALTLETERSLERDISGLRDMLTEWKTHNLAMGKEITRLWIALDNKEIVEKQFIDRVLVLYGIK